MNKLLAALLALAALPVLAPLPLLGETADTQHTLPAGHAWRSESLVLAAAATQGSAKSLLGHANLGWNRSNAGHNHRSGSLRVQTASDASVAADPHTSLGASVSYALLLESPRAAQRTRGAEGAF